jgi:hypothetical protein
MAITKVKAGQVTSKLNATGSTVRGLDDKLAEFVSVKDFGADPTASAAVNTVAINAAFASGAKRVVAEPGAVYAINGQISIASALEFDGQGCTFSATLGAGVRLLQVTAAASIKNVTLDFNDGYAINAINFPTANVGYLELVNVAVRDIYDLDTTSVTIPINFNADQNEIRFESVTLKNIKKRSDLNVNTVEGGIEGIYIFTATAGAVGGGGYLNNINVENLSTVNASNVVVEDTCNAIYLAYGSSNDRRTRITISNVRGLNFGRRLFKLQCDDLFIRNVYAESVTYAALSAISIQDFDTFQANNIKVKDAIIRGSVRFGVAVYAANVLLDGIDCNVTLNGVTSPYGTVAVGIAFAGDNMKVVNSSIRADLGIFNLRLTTSYAGNLKDISFSNTTFIKNTSGTVLWQLQESGTAVVDDITFDNITVDNTSKAGALNLGFTGKTNGTLRISNMLVIDDDGAANGGSGLYVEGFDRVNIAGYVHVNKNVSSQVFRSMRFVTCTAVQLSNVTLQATSASISIATSGVTAFNASNVYFNPSITNGLFLATTTASRINGVDRSKVNLSDTASRTGCLFAPEFSSGTTAQRPTAGLLAGQQHWDTTLAKPIWWNGSVWKDAAGVTV